MRLSVGQPVDEAPSSVAERDPLRMTARFTDAVILHVALQPVAGPWSVMRALALQQRTMGRYREVALGLVTDSSWPTAQEQELAESGLPTFRAVVPHLPGTLQFLLQRIRPADVKGWVMALVARTGARKVILHFHNAWMSGVFLPVSPPPGCALASVVTFHGVASHFASQPFRHAIHRWLTSRLFCEVVALTAVDSQTPNAAEQIFGLPRRDFTIIPNGVPATGVRACPILANPEGSFTVGHIGRLVAGKGWQIAYEGVRRLRDQGMNIRLVLAGLGPDSDHVARLANDHPSWLEFRGYVPNARETLMGGLDALAVMSDNEGLPMTIVEGLSVGLPSVATPVGGIPDAVVDGTSGLLVSRTVEDFMAAVAGMNADRAKLRRLSQGALAIFHEKFDIAAVSELYDHLYLRSLGEVARTRKR